MNLHHHNIVNRATQAVFKYQPKLTYRSSPLFTTYLSSEPNKVATNYQPNFHFDCANIRSESTSYQ